MGGRRVSTGHHVAHFSRHTNTCRPEQPAQSWTPPASPHTPLDCRLGGPATWQAPQNFQPGTHEAQDRGWKLWRPDWALACQKTPWLGASGARSDPECSWPGLYCSRPVLDCPYQRNICPVREDMRHIGSFRPTCVGAECPVPWHSTARYQPNLGWA